ncbi:MAG: exo-beta-N-acetylmuramidase NamZ family protein [Bacteroidales bacterium]
MNKIKFLFSTFFLFSTLINAEVKVGAAQLQEYLPLLKNKRIGLVANHTSLLNNVHLLDTLRSIGVNIIRVFAPEHGFRGNADAGEMVSSYVDKKTGVEISSIYGSQKKPTPRQLQGVDIMIFDMQDVGARFYTYLSTMHYIMEACAENIIPIIVLDRPNPNGHYVDGPILQMQYTSFVGMHPIPIVHGMTLGELAEMINGENWLKNGIKCSLTVIKCEAYTHSTKYTLPVNPSPNLPNMRSVYLYPSLCLFEATPISVGRGTSIPFQIFGHPEWTNKTFTFSPKSIIGAAKKPIYENQKCYGVNLTTLNEDSLANLSKIDLQYIIQAYNTFPNKSKFFTKFFTKLAGTTSLQSQIEAGYSEAKIRTLWKSELDMFKQLRKKYLLYSDF